MNQEFSFGHVMFSLDIQAKMVTYIRSSSGEKSDWRYKLGSHEDIDNIGNQRSDSRQWGEC